jgi:hypothetical protein
MRDTTAPRFVVEVITREHASRTFQLSCGSYRVGTQDTCDLVIDDRWISREHLAVEVSEHAIRVVDLGSTNGSYCNGVGFHERIVLPGSSIAIGATVLRIRWYAAPQPSHATFSRPATQLGYAPGARTFPSPAPTFATGSFPPTPVGWPPPRMRAPAVARVTAQRVASRDVLEQPSVRAAPANQQSRVLVRWFLAWLVSNTIVAGVIVAYPAVLDPVCEHHERFGVVRQHARDVHSAIGEHR